MGDGSVAIGVIVNPRAGGGRTLGLLPALAAELQRIGEPSHLYVSGGGEETIGAASRMARAGARLVVAVGGDGTCNEVANGLLRAGETRAALGVVATGRGVDFATALGVPGDPVAALAAACRADVRRIDACRVEFAGGERFLVNAGGVGIDAEVARRAGRSRLGGRRGPYLVALGAALPRFRPFAVTVEADGERLAGRVLAVVVGNGPTMGGGFALAADAVLDDGLLDVAVVGGVSALDLLRRGPTLARGERVEHRALHRRRVAAIWVEIAEDRAVRLQIDGEVVAEPGRRIGFTVLPGALRVAG